MLPVVVAEVVTQVLLIQEVVVEYLEIMDMALLEHKQLEMPSVKVLIKAVTEVVEAVASMVEALALAIIMVVLSISMVLQKVAKLKFSIMTLILTLEH